MGDKKAFPGERASQTWLVQLRDGTADLTALNPEEMLMAAEAPEEEVRGTEALGGWRDLEALLPRLPVRDQDILRLTLRQGLCQRQVGRLLGITQCAVSYRMLRIRIRLAWLRTVPALDEDALNADLDFLAPVDRRLLWLVYVTTCQTKAARILLGEFGPDFRPQIDQNFVGRRTRQLLKRMRSSQAGTASSWASKARMFREAGVDNEALRRARKAHDEAVSRLTSYIAFFTSLCEDRRWNILSDVQNESFRAAADRKAAIAMADPEAEIPVVRRARK